jgi:sugar/nucleoside kinase (ribokinase family)
VPVVIVVAGVANVEVSVPVDGFPLAYAPVCYPQGRTRVRVAGVGFNVAAALGALDVPVRLATFVGTDPLGAVVEAELRARDLWGPWTVCRRSECRRFRGLVTMLLAVREAEFRVSTLDGTGSGACCTGRGRVSGTGRLG